jgi:hypothetical protein
LKKGKEKRGKERKGKERKGKERKGEEKERGEDGAQRPRGWWEPVEDSVGALRCAYRARMPCACVPQAFVVGMVWTVSLMPAITLHVGEHAIDRSVHLPAYPFTRITLLSSRPRLRHSPAVPPIVQSASTPNNPPRAECGLGTLDAGTAVVDSYLSLRRSFKSSLSPAHVLLSRTAMRHGIQRCTLALLIHTPIPTFFCSTVSLLDSPPASSFCWHRSLQHRDPSLSSVFSFLIWLGCLPFSVPFPFSFSESLFRAVFIFSSNFFSRSSGIPHRVWISGTLFCICTCTYSLRCVGLSFAYIPIYSRFLFMFNVAVNLYCSLLMFFFHHCPSCFPTFSFLFITVFRV